MTSLSVDVASWKMSRRFPAGTGVYNLAMTKDGRLVATNKQGQSVSVFDPKVAKSSPGFPPSEKLFMARWLRQTIATPSSLSRGSARILAR